MKIKDFIKSNRTVIDQMINDYYQEYYPEKKPKRINDNDRIGWLMDQLFIEARNRNFYDSL